MPEAVFELMLMEKFGWTPNQVAEIPESKIKEMSLIMRQRETTIRQAKEMQEKSEQAKAEGTRKEIGSGGIKRYQEV